MSYPGLKTIPFVGGSLYKVGQVYDIVSQPCQPVPSITVKAMFANLPMLVWSLFKPDPVDFVTDKFGQVHKRRRKQRFTVQTVDIGLPKGGGGIRWVEFASVRFAERVGWYFLVVDATATFAVNWMSMAYRYSGCQDPLTGHAQTSFIGDQQWLSNGSDFQLGGGTASFSPGYFANHANVVKQNAGPRAVGGSATFEFPANTPHGNVTGVYVKRTPQGFEGDIEGDLSGQQAGGGQSAYAQYRGYNILESAATYQLWVKSTPGWMKVTAWNLSISGLESPGLEPDP